MAHACPLGELDRRRFLALLGVGLVGALAACASRGAETLSPPVPGSAPPGTRPRPPAPTSAPGDSAATTATTAEVATTPPTLPRIPEPRPGPPVVLTRAAAPTSGLAWTVDDGTCAECVAGYVDFAERTGIHLTFLPNGIMREFWQPHAKRLEPLIARGQVQIANHTWSHPDLVRVAPAAVAKEISHNETWIEDVFRITARPYFRPPYGSHNGTVDRVAGDLGFTSVVTWNATLGDATVETPDVLMGEARRWIAAGSILLGHANHPTVLGLFDELRALIDERGLHPVTLDEMFATSRREGASVR